MSCKVVSSKIVLCVFVRVCETCMQMCMSAYVYVYVFTHVHTFEFMYTCVYISVCESVCVRGFQHCVWDTLKLVHRCRILSRQTVPKLRAIEFD